MDFQTLYGFDTWKTAMTLFDGMVGIGTAAPQTAVHVQGANVSNVGQLEIQGAGANVEPRISFYDGNGTRRGLVGHDGSNFFFKDTNVLAVDASNRVGIGTTAPGATLDVNGDVNVATTLSIANGWRGFRINGSGDGPHRYDLIVGPIGGSAAGSDGIVGNHASEGGFSIFDDTAGAYRFAIDRTGNVGVGTIYPGKPLDVVGTIATRATSGSTAMALSADALGGNLWVNAAYDSANPGSGWTRVLTATSTGNVGIGTTSPQRPVHVKDVLRLEPRTTAPSSPAEGDLYASSTDHVLYYYNGSSWRALAVNAVEPGLPTGIASADVLNHLTFDGNTTDTGVNAAGTSLAGTISYVTGVFGQAGSGFSTSNAVALTRALLSGSTSTGVTYAAWIKGTDTTATSGDCQVANNIFGDTHNNVWDGEGVSQGKAAVRGCGAEFRSTRSVADGAWHHVAYVFTYSGGTWTVAIYVDGAADGGGSMPTGGNSYYAVNTIGRTYTGYTQVHGYAVDSAYVFAKALSAAQVAQLAVR